MELDEKRIQQLVDRVVARLGVEQSSPPIAPAVISEIKAAPGARGFPRGSLGARPSRAGACSRFLPGTRWCRRCGT